MAVVEGCALGQGEAGKFAVLVIGETLACRDREQVIDFKDAPVVEAGAYFQAAFGAGGFAPARARCTVCARPRFLGADAVIRAGRSVVVGGMDVERIGAALGDGAPFAIFQAVSADIK